MRRRRGATSTREQGSNPRERELAWVVANPGRARAWSESGRISAFAMATTLGLGLVVHVVGYGIGDRTFSLPDWVPTDLASTLVSNLGIVLWTYVVLVVFLEILPARTRRRAARSMALAAQELRERGEPVPAELADAEAMTSDGGRTDRDRTLDAVLDRLTSIEHRLANRPD
jgi:hypothetical protein